MTSAFSAVKIVCVATAATSLGFQADAIKTPEDVGSLTVNSMLLIVVVLLWRKLGQSQIETRRCLEDRADGWHTFATLCHQNNLKQPEVVERKLEEIAAAKKEKEK